jgi:cytochrome c-type biogenesis protein CcmF
VQVGNHSITYVSTRAAEDDVKRELIADVRLDGGQVYAPALQLYKASGETIGTPSVRTGLTQDVYLTLERQPDADGTTTITVRIVPFLVWLWMGAAVIALGTLLAAFPGRRRRPIDPVSAPVPPPERELVGAADG